MIRVAKSWKTSSKFRKLSGISFFGKVSGNFGKFPEFFFFFFLKVSGNFGHFPSILETFRDFILFIFLETFREFWKLSGNFGNLPGILEAFRDFFFFFWKLSGNFGSFPGFLFIYFFFFWKVSGNFGNFPGFFEIYRDFWKVSGNLPEIFHPFATLCMIQTHINTFMTFCFYLFILLQCHKRLKTSA